MTHDYKAALDEMDRTIEKAIENGDFGGFDGMILVDGWMHENSIAAIRSALQLAQEVEQQKTFEESLPGHSIGELTDKLRADGHGVALDDAFRHIYRHLVKRLSDEAEQLRKERDELADAVVRYKEGGWWGHADRIISTYQLAKKVRGENGN